MNKNHFDFKDLMAFGMFILDLSKAYFQKIVLAFLVFIIVLFYIIYAFTIKKEGFEYNNAILTPKQEHDVTVYSGKIKGELAKFTVFEDKSIEFQYGDKVYGPYVAKENPDVIPINNAFSSELTGIEIYDGEGNL